MLKQGTLDGYQCRGSIVNVTSLCAHSAIPFLTAYSATKAAILGISKTDALDYGPEGIRVNCVAPGNTETPMVYNAMGKEYMEANARLNPLRRNAQPEDIANAIVWLSSPRAGYFNGILLLVDGGQNLFTGHDHG
jgi:NAD(P)-dependent dehydrogenase (short-subunit alcohol dehydrogenase family)